MAKPFNKGKLVYKGTYFSVYEKLNWHPHSRYFIYEKGWDQPTSRHRDLHVAKAKAQALNKKASNLSWWDRD